ncbi:hypothetical protein CASFOL_000118 [Castilleja foliolosa]|uniref:Rieske domain-containing protein n=1 Tax=Castilleja foliolosa TaxID=1961234 RepID=A0ABD3ENB2_9LAMI
MGAVKIGDDGVSDLNDGDRTALAARSSGGGSRLRVVADSPTRPSLLDGVLVVVIGWRPGEVAGLASLLFLSHRFSKDSIFLFNSEASEMFKNTFQSGFLSILYSLGSKPLQIWDKEDGNGELRCYEDRCPHSFFGLSGASQSNIFMCRLAKLSEGQLFDGRLECLYHGWQFEGNGKCRVEFGSPIYVTTFLDYLAVEMNILARTSADKLVKVWDVATEICNLTLENHTDK